MPSIRPTRATRVALCLISLPSFAAAQVVNPATAHTPETLQEQVERQHSWEMPTTVVTGESWSPYRESDLIGSYGQPRWSARRLFPTTRTYVIPEGQLEFEHWTRVKTPRDGKSTVETQ